MDLTKVNYASLIDHTLLKPEATQKDIEKLIKEAKAFQFKTICVNSSWVKFSYEKLKDTNIGITSVVGFPLGACITQAKVFEAKLALEHGASEVDMVMNIGRFKDGQDEYVLNDIKAVKQACNKHLLKVIVETALLSESEIIRATSLVLAAGADFVKTSTGFSYRGAELKDIEIMKKVVGDKIGIKAAGGVKTFEDLEKMVLAGATRIGTSSGAKIFASQEVNQFEY